MINKMILTAEQRTKTEEIWDRILRKMERVRERSRDKLPYTAVNGIHDDRSAEDRDWPIDNGINWWTNGFWGGISWMLFDETKDTRYAETARISEEKMDACFEMYHGLHHDTGFMWRPTAAIDYDLTGSRASLRRAMHAASLLAGRFNPAGNFIRAWNDIPGQDEDTRGWVIIDSLMNLSLLYWASERSRDPRFRNIAKAHADTVMRYFIREDGSARHICGFDPETGAFLRSYAGQGYSLSSSWSRGQGWALCGFMISYRHTGEERYLQTAKRIASYVLEHVPESGIIPVDFLQPAEPAWEDGSGACILSCGLLRLAEEPEVSSEMRMRCLKTALRILFTIADTRCDWSGESDCIVQNCSAAYHNPEHHTTMIYADFFLIEAVTRLRGSRLELW